jgi:hypothetical protein
MVNTSVKYYSYRIHTGFMPIEWVTDKRLRLPILLVDSIWPRIYGDLY